MARPRGRSCEKANDKNGKLPAKPIGEGSGKQEFLPAKHAKGREKPPWLEHRSRFPANLSGIVDAPALTNVRFGFRGQAKHFLSLTTDPGSRPSLVGPRYSSTDKRSEEHT